MNFGEAIASGFQNYVNFGGRASRSEYWYWTLFACLLSVATNIIDIVVFSDLGFAPVSSLVGLGLFLPGLAVTFRRFHDLDRTAWWFWIFFTVIGAIVIIVWFCTRGTVGANRYGPDPLAGAI